MIHVILDEGFRVVVLVRAHEDHGQLTDWGGFFDCGDRWNVAERSNRDALVRLETLRLLSGATGQRRAVCGQPARSDRPMEFNQGCKFAVETMAVKTAQMRVQRPTIKIGVEDRLACRDATIVLPINASVEIEVLEPGVVLCEKRCQRDVGGKDLKEPCRQFPNALGTEQQTCRGDEGEGAQQIGRPEVVTRQRAIGFGARSLTRKVRKSLAGVGPLHLTVVEATIETWLALHERHLARQL